MSKKLLAPMDLQWWLENMCAKAQGTANKHEMHLPLMIAFRIDNGKMGQMAVCPLDEPMSESKYLARRMANAFLEHIKADGYFFIHEAWFARVPNPETWDPDKDETRASKMEGRQSILRVEGRLRDGEKLCRMMIQSNLTGERFTGEWESVGFEDVGMLSNFFQQEPSEVKKSRQPNN